MLLHGSPDAYDVLDLPQAYAPRAGPQAQGNVMDLNGPQTSGLGHGPGLKCLGGSGSVLDCL
jgi:hypothetical protein